MRWEGKMSMMVARFSPMQLEERGTKVRRKIRCLGWMLLWSECLCSPLPNLCVRNSVTKVMGD